ncbi:MAG: hypothetical protein HQK63_17450, partial [Desulfamplus sp.]|nr:hypothetical protein [Desulfamplus sp.]
NIITIQAYSSSFTVYRSGATVTFQGNDGTVVKIPSTTSVQTIIFNDVTKPFVIQAQQVLLGRQVISTTSVAILSDECSEHPFKLMKEL